MFCIARSLTLQCGSRPVGGAARIVVRVLTGCLGQKLCRVSAGFQKKKDNDKERRESHISKVNASEKLNLYQYSTDTSGFCVN